MLKSFHIKFTRMIVFSLAAMIRDAQAEPVTNAYEIVSGEYTACCGIAGEMRWTLPNDSQSHVHLITDGTQQSAQMILLGYGDGEPVFRIFNNGRIYSDRIEFGFPGPAPGPGPGLGWEHYVVSNSTNGIRIDGATVRPVIGADIPNRFTHSNVVANLLPSPPVRATIRVAVVEICWESISNRQYQVQYRSVFGTNQWTNLQSPVFGNGGIRCVSDKVNDDQPRRFYRVLPLP